jgi:CDGSH-type Zn-finger protein
LRLFMIRPLIIRPSFSAENWDGRNFSDPIETRQESARKEKSEPQEGMVLGDNLPGIEALSRSSAATAYCREGESQRPPHCANIHKRDGAGGESEEAGKPCTCKKERIKTLYVFDLDDTLVRSPEPAEAMRRWASAHGQMPAKKVKGDGPRGWYERPESLDNCIGITRGPVFNLWEVCTGKKDALCIILTARVETLRPQVEKLAAEVLPVRSPDLVLMKPLDTPLKTPWWKASEIERLAREYPAAKRILFWDDRSANLRAVASLSKVAVSADVLVLDANGKRSGRKKL